MSDPRRTPGAVFWTTVVLVFGFILYPLSIGPALWLEDQGFIPEWASDTVDLIYAPFDMVVERLPMPLQGRVGSYLAWWLDENPGAWPTPPPPVLFAPSASEETPDSSP
jgi:hypothetical protein